MEVHYIEMIFFFALLTVSKDGKRVYRILLHLLPTSANMADTQIAAKRTVVSVPGLVS